MANIIPLYFMTMETFEQVYVKMFYSNESSEPLQRKHLAHPSL